MTRATRKPTRPIAADRDRDELYRLLREREQLLHGVVENTLSLIYVKDLAGHYLLYNQPFADAFQLAERGAAEGQSAREVLLGRDDLWLDPRLQPLWRANDLLAAEAPVSIQEWSDHPTRGRLTYHSTKFPLFDLAGRVYATCGISVDTTDRTRADELVREAEERFRSAFEDAPIGTALIALDGRILRANRALCEITGRSIDELLQTSLDLITHPDDLETHGTDVLAVRDPERGEHRAQKRFFKADGQEVWVETSASLVRDTRSEPQHLIVQIQDISERKSLEARLQQLADTDYLTGIRNRRLFEEDLRTQVSRSQRYGEHAAMLMFDLDDFKKVNDTYGHKVGDDLLRAVGAALRGRLRSGDRAARLGGDEFAVLMANVSAAQAQAVASDIRRTVMQARVTVGTDELTPGVSMGLVLIDESAVSDEAVLAEADRSMYAAKRASKAAAAL